MNLKECIDLAFSVRPAWINGKSVQTTRINCNHLLRILGTDLDISTIKPSTFTKLGNILQEEGYANATVNHVMAALHTCLHEAHLEGVIDTVPSYRRLKLPPARKEWYTKEEIHTLIEEANNVRRDGQLLSRSLKFMYLTGCRRGEVLSLMWDDVDLVNKQLTFRDTKNGTDHTLAIHEQLLPMLEEMYQLDKMKWEVFNWGSAEVFNNRMKELQKITGLGSNRGLHQIRHTTATHLVEAGVPIRSIQGLLNHKDIKTTVKYAKVNDKAKAEAIANLSL